MNGKIVGLTLGKSKNKCCDAFIMGAVEHTLHLGDFNSIAFMSLPHLSH
jgi:hypothetical protein